jgi:flagellar basal body rod protein FlgG
MKLAAGINFDANGIAQSINAMQMSMDIMGMFSENVVGFDKVGYQRKEAVISSFAEYIGTNALSHSVDEQVGRLAMTQKPLDIALSDKGYFQVLNKDGSIELTRDGRFKINKMGELLTQTNQKVLSTTGLPIILPVIPEEIDKIKIGLDGKVGVFDKEKRGLVPAGTIGIISSDGSLVSSNCVRQGYIESSNVQLEKEAMELANYKRSFEANRQMFRLQNSKLSAAISKLGNV